VIARRFVQTAGVTGGPIHRGPRVEDLEELRPPQGALQAGALVSRTERGHLDIGWSLRAEQDCVSPPSTLAALTAPSTAAVAARRTLVRKHRSVILFGTLALGACTGHFESAAPPDDRTLPTAEECAAEPWAPVAPMRRLTAAQYATSLRRLFGDGVEVPPGYRDPFVQHGFRTYAELSTVDDSGALAIAESAFAVAGRESSDPAALFGCDPDDDCANDWVASFAERAYRRAPSEGELTTLRGVFADLRTGGYSTTEAASAVIETVLSSPQFLYLSEVGAQAPPGTIVPLTGEEIAQRMSYFLIDSPPDEELMRVAASGALSDPAVRLEQAERLADDPRMVDAFARFVTDWLELSRLQRGDKNDERFPEWDQGLRESVEGETGRFLRELFDRDARFDALFTAPFVVVDAELAALYGVAAPADGWAAVDAPAERRGLLTHAAFLAAHASTTESGPVQRGATLLRSVLCSPIEMPDNLMIGSPSVDTSRTLRERFTEHRANPACAACHDRIDPLGFGFENYDAIGAYRTEEAPGLPVDATGQIAGIDDLEGSFDGGVELSAILASAPVVRECFVVQAYQYAMGRAMEPSDSSAHRDDACAVRQIADRFAEADGDLRALWASIAASDAFATTRAPEVSP
jgi:hypothetical protein